MTQEQRQQGGVVLHFIIVIYLCGILGYICDDYFVPSLEIIADSEGVFFGCLALGKAGVGTYYLARPQTEGRFESLRNRGIEDYKKNMVV